MEGKRSGEKTRKRKRRKRRGEGSEPSQEVEAGAEAEAEVEKGDILPGHSDAGCVWSGLVWYIQRPGSEPCLDLDLDLD